MFCKPTPPRSSSLRSLLPRACLTLSVFGFFWPAAALHAQTPISWWKADKNATDSVGGNDGTLQGGVSYGPGAVNQGFAFSGTDGVVHIPDAPSLALTGSFTITADVFVQQTPSYLGQIFFRGDNRIGLDPYYLAVTGAGDLVFHVENASGQSSEVEASLPLHEFAFVGASLDDATGQMLLRINNQVVAQTTTTIRPFKDLDPFEDPGVGIGNTQDPSSYNEAFNGTLDNVKIYGSVVPGPVPEASQAASFGLLLALGLGGLVIAARRKRTTVKAASAL